MRADRDFSELEIRECWSESVSNRTLFGDYSLFSNLLPPKVYETADEVVSFGNVSKLACWITSEQGSSKYDSRFMHRISVLFKFVICWVSRRLLSLCG